MTYHLDDPTTWPDTTLVVRGGVNTLEELRDALQRFGGISVVSRPGVRFEDLAASVRNNKVRRTTVIAVLSAGGWLIPTHGEGEPPNHCNLFGLTAESLDHILSSPEPNPVQKDERWRGAPR